MKKLDDKEIRSKIISRLFNYKDCKIFDEVTVPSGKARVDIVSVNGHLIGLRNKK